MNNTDKVPFLHHQQRTTWLAVGIAVTAVTLITTALYARVSLAAVSATKIPMPVEITQFKEQSAYLHPVSYLGLIEARRKTALGFERSGLLTSVHVREGSVVLAGELLAQLDDSSLQAQKKATESELQQMQAELELAHLKEQRQQNLQLSGAVSREAHDETRLQARALLAAVGIVKAKLEGLEIELHKLALTAPYDGVVSVQYIDIGTVVSVGKPVVQLLETANMEAHIGVAVSQSEKLLAGQTYELTFRHKAVNARLRAVRPDVNAATRAVTAVFEIPHLTPGLDGEPVSLTLASPVEAVGGWLPISALLEGERGAWTVLKVDKATTGHTTSREVVEVLEVQGDRAYVRGTIADGDQLVASGVHRITPGTAVTAAEVN